MRPDLVAAQANLGLAIQEQGQFDAALAHYERLIAGSPNVVEYRWNRGLARLSSGDFEHGWPDYELRNSRSGRSVERQFPFAPWTGAPLSARNLLVYGEQGLGDEIMFASCLPDVITQARSVVVECDRHLEALFQRSFPAAAVHGAPRDSNRTWLHAFPELDTQIAISSLALHLRRQWSDFPDHHGYLRADPARVRFWASRLAGLGAGRKIGLSWRGGTVKTRREARSLEIEHCLPLLQVRGCRFVCLQAGDCADELALLRGQGAQIEWWHEAVADLDELAALVTALDLVISVPTAVAHLTGAL
jgi:hypothetical protein